MTALEQFNALNGTKAYRKDLENILQKAQDENNASLVYRISKTLNDFPDVNRFEIEIISYPEAPQGLSGAQHSGNYREALDDCGRLRKGWKFVKGNVVKIQKKEKPKKESKPKKETGPVKSKEENNSKKETKKDKKYKFVVITDDRHSRVIAVFSYTNPNIKDLRESFWKNGEGKYYETTEEGLRNYTFGMGVYPFEEAKKHIEEKYTEGKDFIYFIIEKDGGRDEAISLVEKPKKEIEPVKSKGEKASNFSLLQEPTKVLLKFSKDTNKEYYKKYTDEKGFVGVDFLKDNLKDLKKQAIIDEPQGFINTEDFEKSHKASKIKGIDSLKTIVSKDKLYPYLECVFIEPDTYVATDALKIVVLNRPKNDGLKTGAFYDPNFKCEKLGGCSKEEFYKDLERGFPNYKGVLFPKPKYFTEWIPLEPLIKHLKTGLEVLTKISGLKRVFTIAIKSNIEEKRFDIKNLLDVLLVLESNEAKKIRIEIFKELGNHPIQIKTDNNNLAVIMPLNPNSESSNVISPLKIAPIQLEFILNETEEKAPTKETGPVKAKEEKKEAEEKTSAKKELPRDFSEDLDYKSLYNSYSLISFDPERRAENDKKMFGASMLNLYNSSVEEAKENNRLEEYNQAFERYYAVILKKNKEVISARTGTFSTAVTGGAGIKANQIRKNEAKQKREYEINKELIDYIEKAEKKLNEVARNPDQFYKDQAIKRTDKNAIEKLNQKIELLEAEKDFIKRSEKACKEYQKTKDFSVFEKYNIPQKEAKEYVEQIERHGLPLIKGSSSINAEIRRVKERIALLEKSKESEDENFDIENGRILVNKEAQRVQIFFDNIPDANTRDALKKRAFKWAPSAKAWQRTLTGNAIDAVKYLIKDGVLVKKNSEKTGLNAPRHKGILKEALTEKGKLKKGWYFQDYGIFDPKGKYHPLEREFAYEYKIASDELRSRAFKQDEKNKQKGFEENIQIENNLKEFFKSLSQKNRKYFKSYKAVEIFYWAFGFGEKPTNFFTIEETNPYNEIQLKVFDKYFSNKNELFTRLENYETLRRYNLTNLGLNIITQIASFLNKEGKKVRGDVKKINEKYGLSMPFYVQEQEKKEIQPSSNSISNKIKAFQGRNFEIFNIENPDLSTFLGEIERKNIGSTVITLTGGAGSGKTRFAFQFMNALAQNYKVGHASLEEHPESKLYFDKVTQYLDSQAQNNISVLENETLDGLENLINENEVIVIDSFAKLREMDSKFLVDKDLRKKYNGKLFLVIFQQTSDGKMRGGSTSEFDGDIILFTKTFDDPKENFVYPSKNRYNALPLSELKYSVFYQQLLQDEEQQEQPVTDLIFDVVY